jgi:Holliday junction resolvasome RuvABC ATP-dependent DNA helicase subunit
MNNQLERIFFKRELNDQDLKRFADLVNPDNPISPFNKFVGNRKAIKKLCVVAYNALQKNNHLCNSIYFSLVGPPSAGKTTLVKLFAETLKLPLIEISPRSIRNIDDFFYKTYTSFKEQNLPLKPIENMFYKLPASIIFIDEVHALKNNIVQGLLKATEKSDAVLVTESGYKINCKKACWIIATTDIGKVFDAFKSRFSNIELSYLTKKEISKVVKINHPELPDDVCDLVAKYNPMIPRKALEFSRYMILYKNMYREKSWEQVAFEVAESEGIDEYGMTETSIKVLRFLFENGKVASKRLEYLLGKKMEEIEKYVLPALICGGENHPPLINVTRGGLKITDYGKEELMKRKSSEDSLT